MFVEASWIEKNELGDLEAVHPKLAQGFQSGFHTAKENDASNQSLEGARFERRNQDSLQVADQPVQRYDGCRYRDSGGCG